MDSRACLTKGRSISTRYLITLQSLLQWLLKNRYVGSLANSWALSVTNS